MATAEPSATDRTLIGRRTRGLLVVAVVAVLAACGGYGASQWIKSPAQLAAETAAPPPSVITSSVENRQVTSGMVARGTVGSFSTIEAVPSGSPAGVVRALITKLPVNAGEELRPGDVVLEVSGQPVFYLPGAIPAYRNLTQGATGPDVAQLQRALKRAGYGDSDQAGTYGPGTAGAVLAMFTNHGYAPVNKGTLPMTSVAYVDSPTSTVVTMDARLGEDASKASVQLAAGDLVVFVPQTAASVSEMRVGAKAALTAELLNRNATGIVTKIVPATAGAPAQAIIVPTTPFDPQWAGQDIRVEITRTGTQGKVLAVPVTAVYLGGDGITKVVVVKGSTRTEVAVTVGATGGGYAEISPHRPDAIQAGDQVVVGTQ